MIRRGVHADVDAASSLLAEAFADSPWLRWTVEALGRRERIASLQRLVMENAVLPYGEMWVAVEAETLVGAAMWMHPDRPPPAAVWNEISSQQPTFEGTRHQASLAADHAVEELRPTGPHYYLGAIGVRPDRQHRGVGRSLLLPVLDRADAETATAFLETSTATNVDLYEGLGFVVSGELQIPDDGPHVWAMTRCPR